MTDWNSLLKPPAAKPITKRMLSDMLGVVMNEMVETPSGRIVMRVRLMAEQLADKACAGDTQAIKEVFDRLEGKAVQPIAGAEGGELVVHYVARLPEPASDMETWQQQRVARLTGPKIQ